MKMEMVVYVQNQAGKRRERKRICSQIAMENGESEKKICNYFAVRFQSKIRGNGLD